jgi:hypothetical protein
MTNFEHIISYLASKGVKLVVKTNYENGVPGSKTLLTKLVVSKTDRFYRVNGQIVSGNMAKALMRAAA